MATIDKAIEIAARAHAGVADKQGEPYILHPLRVMMGVADPLARIVAVLHDVVEDTELTLDDMRREGFDDQVIEALELVTHRNEQSYAEYVVACKSNEIARQVKLSDLRDNANLARLLLRPDKFATDAARMQKYVLSNRYLEGEVSEEEYRSLMEKLEM